jgi:hypothetical protein
MVLVLLGLAFLLTQPVTTTTATTTSHPLNNRTRSNVLQNSSMPSPPKKEGSRKTVNTGKDKTKEGTKPPIQATLGFKRKDARPGDVGEAADSSPDADRYSHGQPPVVHNVSVSPASPPSTVRLS